MMKLQMVTDLESVTIALRGGEKLRSKKNSATDINIDSVRVVSFFRVPFGITIVTVSSWDETTL
jgi:hypothetical protein